MWFLLYTFDTCTHCHRHIHVLNINHQQIHILLYLCRTSKSRIFVFSRLRALRNKTSVKMSTNSPLVGMVRWVGCFWLADIWQGSNRTEKRLMKNNQKEEEKIRMPVLRKVSLAVVDFRFVPASPPTGPILYCLLPSIIYYYFLSRDRAWLVETARRFTGV